MKNKFLITFLVALITLTGCQKSENPSVDMTGNVSAAQEQSAVHKTNFLGSLTQEQLLEDYDYLWDVMDKSYPFFGVIERRGIDVATVYEKYRSELVDITDGLDLIGLYERMGSDLQNAAHFSIISDTGMYEYIKEIYAEYATDYPHIGVLSKILASPATVETYEKLASIQELQIDTIEPAQTESNESTQTESVSESFIGAMEVMEEEIPYIWIYEFDDKWEDDHSKLIEFYKANADSQNLIIDIRGNGGGADLYWVHNLVEPLLSSPLDKKDYALFNSQSSYTKEYNESLDMYPSAQPVSELPDFPALNKDDRSTLDTFMSSAETISPSQDSIQYEGNIWVLVDEAVYSSSESFAMFCQSSGFATLVGTVTDGDGGGVDPFLVSQPNSGLVFRFSNLYTLNADGSNSEESGTTPDILISEDEDALEVCLDTIQS